MYMKDKDNYVEWSMWCNQQKKDMDNEFSNTNSTSSKQICSDKLIDAMWDRKDTDTTSS